MEDYKEAFEKLFSILEETNKRIDKLAIEVADIKRKTNISVYTDKELDDLKKSLSWKALSDKTGLPISTIQYRIKRYNEAEQ